MPQIVIDGEAVDGADQLAALDRRGVLAPRLARQHSPYPVVRRRLAATKIPAYVAAVLFGGGCRPWRWTVELRTADGDVLERTTNVADEHEARRLAAELTIDDRATELSA